MTDYPCFRAPCPWSIFHRARLTASVRPRYSETMRYKAQVCVLSVLLSAFVPDEASAVPAESAQDRVPTEDYPLYDLIVDEKFLTPETKLVLVERSTLTRLHPEQQGAVRLETFQEYEIFDGRLPAEVVRDFSFKNQTPSRFEGRFGFGVRYRFVTDGGTEQQETSLAPMPVAQGAARFVQEESLDEPPAVLDRLSFSRAAYTFARDQAFIYVEYNRPDGSGAGFAVWLQQSGTRWG